MTGERPFRLGTLGSVYNTRLARVLPQLRGGRAVDVAIGGSVGLYEGLVAGEYDAVFVIDAPEADGLCRARAFFEQAMLVYPDSQTPVCDPRDLEGMPIIGLDHAGCKYEKRLVDWLSTGGVQPAGEIRSPDFASVLRSVVSGEGCAAVPASVLAASGLKTELQADPLPEPYRSVWVELVWRDDADGSVISDLRALLGF